MKFLALVVGGALLLVGLSSFAGPVAGPVTPVAAVATHAASLLMVPEPSTAALLALGFSGLIFVGRRRPR